MADGKPGRRPDSDEMRAAKRRLRAADSEDARAAVEEEIDRLKAREQAARLAGAARLTEEQLFDLIAECEPRIREAEVAKRQATEHLKTECKVLAKACGGMPAARKQLALYRGALTLKGESEARALLGMRRRAAERLGEDTFGEPVAAAEMHTA